MSRKVRPKIICVQLCVCDKSPVPRRDDTPVSVCLHLCLRLAWDRWGVLQKRDPPSKTQRAAAGGHRHWHLQNCFTAKRNKKKCLLYDFQMCFATKEHLLRMKAICGSVLTTCSICGKVLVFFVYDILPVMSTYRVPRYHRDHSHFPSPALKHSTTAWGREKVDVCSHTFGF